MGQGLSQSYLLLPQLAINAYGQSIGPWHLWGHVNLQRKLSIKNIYRTNKNEQIWCWKMSILYMAKSYDNQFRQI